MNPSAPRIVFRSSRAARVAAAILAALFLGAVCLGADKTDSITIRDGGRNIAVGQDDVAEGQRQILALLRSCRSRDDGKVVYKQSDFEDALKKDCVHVVFADPVELADGDVKVSELILTQPTENGVFWLRVGDHVRRFTRFDRLTEAQVDNWVRQVHQ